MTVAVLERYLEGQVPVIEPPCWTFPWLESCPAHWRFVRPKTILRRMQRPVRLCDEVVTCFRDGEVNIAPSQEADRHHGIAAGGRLSGSPSG
jgi:hypothetical protein